MERKPIIGECVDSFFIGFIDFMFKSKNVAESATLFLPHNFKHNNNKNLKLFFN